MADYVVTFDLAPTATGPYYVTGEYVMHQSKVCLVTSTTRLGSTRFRATLDLVRGPTPFQRRSADEWHRSVTAPRR